MKKIFTLCLVYRHPQVLLGMKKRWFGAGRWNGFGGKVAEGETLEETARREFKEEAGVVAGSMEKVGLLDFEIKNPGLVLEVHVFRVDNFVGEPAESEEMNPQWFNVNKIPYESMWLDDKLWFPLFFEGKKFRGRFVFEDDNKLLDHQLAEVEEL